MLKFEQVSKKYPNGLEAVKNISFEIGAGEILALIGPSGCGKTTTMKMINRLIPHTSGRIYVNGKDITTEDPVTLRKNMGYVIQQAGLFPHYTIEDNVGLIPQLKKWNPEKKKQRVTEMLELVGLDPAVFAKRYPKQLSGGQQQRVGVARALAADPEIILMDEPFGALDPITREQLQDELLKLQQNLKKTIVFVTHDMEEALKLGDKIAILKDGELVQIDTPDQILSQPANEFVEGFIGKNRIYQNPEYIPVTNVMRDNPSTALPDRTPAKAITMMRQRKTDTLLVGDKDGKLLGIVSAYDLSNHMDAASIGEVMHPAAVVLEDSGTARDALAIINEAPYGIIPIVDANRVIVGIVTRSSLLTAFASQWVGEKEVLA
ncbi:proline/glycine betaine ABC transporter ATP-binding protein [Paenibacillus sp. TCA20]|uniref:Quaternary amine transport ATP-binding protein n=1 Tax=Paenibacillus urinalis TaxID=521520 RepID=A0AAX3N5N2_9BACL|nr:MULTISPECIES: ABC transporter ATP-binding protein [Paenibacillus]WDH84942.1 ABC transporter ATP-binding protein [Paenibacillus urinalis]WDI04626.1 ABC transporter ATP-binding protein [Paenibacillus urinalis]GAK40531.1 proline/glycine betaine ABC transporter ATP-binding protein [Paenibacillus sp. TCA20]